MTSQQDDENRFDFDKFKDLAISDPEAFEQERLRMIEELISSRSEER